MWSIEPNAFVEVQVCELDIFIHEFGVFKCSENSLGFGGPYFSLVNPMSHG